MSADAGLTWHQVLKGSYWYTMGDHGGVIVAVKMFRADAATKELLYSTDEGETWNTHQFIDEPMRVYGLITGSFLLHLEILFFFVLFVHGLFFKLRTRREYHYFYHVWIKIRKSSMDHCHR